MEIGDKSKRDLVFVIFVSLFAYWIHSIAWPLHAGRGWNQWVDVFTLIIEGNAFQTIDLTQIISFNDCGALCPNFSIRPPVSPLLLGSLFLLGGPVLVEISLSLVFCLVNLAVFIIGSNWGRKTGVISTLLLCLSQPYVNLFHQAGSDSIYAALLMLFFFLGFRFTNHQNYKTTIFISLIAFIISLTRPTGQILFVFWPFILAFMGLIGLKKCIKHLLIFSSISGVLLLCWAMFFFVTTNSFKINFSVQFPMYKVHVIDQIVHPENGPVSKEFGRIIKENIDAGKYGSSITDAWGSTHPVTVETFLGAGITTLTSLMAVPRAQYSVIESNQLIFRTAIEAIITHPRLYLRSTIRQLHESFLVGKILDYSEPDDRYARARKGPITSLKDKMMALPIRDGDYQLRSWLNAYRLPSMYFWIVAGLGILVGTLGLGEIALIGYFFLSLCHSFVTALASWSVYEYGAPFEPIYIIIGVVGLSKAVYAIRTKDFGAFKRLFRVLHGAVFLASLCILPIILLHESQSPTILGRYSTFLFFLVSFDLFILVGLVFTFIGNRRWYHLHRSRNISEDRFYSVTRTYNYISAGLIFFFFVVWFPLAYSRLLNNI